VGYDTLLYHKRLVHFQSLISHSFSCGQATTEMHMMGSFTKHTLLPSIY